MIPLIFFSLILLNALLAILSTKNASQNKQPKETNQEVTGGILLRFSDISPIGEKEQSLVINC